MPITSPPCDWPVQPCGPLPEEESGEVYEELRAAATEVLWALSGRQFGCCPVIYRPCRADCVGQADPLPWGGYLSDGKWYNYPCRSCGDRCSCSELCEVRLPGGVCDVTEVTVDGVALGESEYRVDDLSWLVRQGVGCWPTCQDMSKPLGEEGTWGVTYTRGTPVPAGGQRAAGQLMSELWLACENDDKCILPRRVQIFVRGGQPLIALDPMSFLKEGKTGLYFVDLWLAAVNPEARPAAARVISPDAPLGRETTWP